MSHLLAAFDSRRSAGDPDWLARFRAESIDRFARLGFPTADDEAWRGTSAEPIVRAAFAPARPASLGADDLARLAPAPLAFASRLVCVDGRFAPEHSSVAGLPVGAVVSSLAEAIARHPGLVESHLGRLTGSPGRAFPALNGAFFDDGAFVFLPAGAALDWPLELLFVTAAGGRLVSPRTLVVLGASSRLTVVETYAGPEGTAYLTNAVTEVVVGEGSTLDHIRIQREGLEAFHLGATDVRLGPGSRYRSGAVAEGGALARAELGVEFAGEGARCDLDGLFVGRGEQHQDNRTTIDHARPGCTSRELYKGVLGDRARGVFTGRVVVREDAQKTDARQSAKSLLLSNDAAVSAKPQLEIRADDVKCSHGASVGQLDREALFYLRARGIGEADARAMLVRAFAGEVTSRLGPAPLRQAVEERVQARLFSGGPA